MKHITFIIIAATLLLVGCNSAGDESVSAPKKSEEFIDTAQEIKNSQSPAGLEIKYADDKTEKLHAFAKHKCECGQKAFADMGDIDDVSSEDVKKMKIAYKNCIGQYRTSDIIEMKDKSIVSSYMIENCPQVFSTFKRLKDR